MARGGAKKGAKGVSSTKNTNLAPTGALNGTTASNIPDPFSPIPKTSKSLAGFVSTLPKTHIFTIHRDDTPITLKRRVFLVPVCLNLAILGLLVWRAYTIAPTYLEQIITIFGYETSFSVTPSDMRSTDLMSTVTNRAVLLMIDYALFFGLGRWPWEFLFGSKYSRHVGPMGWRWNLGIKEQEWIVRRSRKWHVGLVGLTDEERQIKEREKGTKAWTKEEELMVQFKLETALRKSYTDKTGYLLLDKDWDLDFLGIVDMQDLIDEGQIKISSDKNDFDHVALVPWDGGWVCWYPNRQLDDVLAQNGVKDEKLDMFRTALTDMGCEDVFFRWIEIVQYETSLPAGFEPQKKKDALAELKRMLTQRKKDYSAFVDSLGGEAAIPGLAGGSGND